jgi:cysteine desulfurase
MERIYLDNNATTPVLPEVWKAMRPYQTDVYGNPASAHHAGRRARQALEDARERTASLLGAHADEVIFTSGATEANNLAIFGLAGDASGHVISSPIEHPCVIEPIRHLADAGFEVAWLAVDEDGIVRPETLPSFLRANTRLVCIMLANHETGAVQPIASLVGQVPAGTAFHCDAAAAVGKIPVSFGDLGVTSLTVSAHKFHGPKGIGALLLRRSTNMLPRLFGGHQQQGRRPGTEPVDLAVGLAAALELACRDARARTEHIGRLRSLLLDQLRSNVAPIVVNGPVTGALPATLNVSFPGCPAESLLMNLDLAGIACSTGSACSSGSLLPSPVLQAMGVPDRVLRSALRLSFSALLTEAAMEEAARRIVMVVKRLRQCEAASVDDRSSAPSS